MKDCLLGIDIGTTATKLMLLGSDGSFLGEHSLPCVLSSLQPGWSEEDPLQWWQNVCDGIPKLLNKVGCNANLVAGIGVGGMVPALVLLDEKGSVLRPAMLQNDARAIKEIEWMQCRTRSEDILRLTGSSITQQSIGPKLLWIARNEPELFPKIQHVMGSYDYIVHLLTEMYCSERNWALESGLFDYHEEDWDERLLELSGIKRNVLGILKFPSEVVGKLTAFSARACGLNPGTPVVAGCADHIASALSAGLMTEGDLLVKLGGSGDILYVLDRPETDARLYLDYHAVSGKFVLNGCMATSGSLIRWFRDQFAPGISFADLDKEAANIPPGSNGLVVLPYFLGEKTPLNDPLARGTLVGLTLTHTRAHIYHAILEGIAFGFRHHLQVLAEHGCHATYAKVTNGGAHSQLWRQITADVLGIPLQEISLHPGSSLGTAFIAGKGIGTFKNWGEIEKMIRIANVTEPRKEFFSTYNNKFEIYLEIYQRLKNIYPRLTLK